MDTGRNISSATLELRAFVNQLPVGFVILDENACIKLFNPTAENIFGFTSEEVVGKEIVDRMPELYFLCVLNSSTIKTGDGIRELVGYHKNGSRLFLDVSICVVNDGGKRSFACVIQNNTGQKQAEEKLQWLLAAMDQIPNSVLLTDKNGNVVFVNKSFLGISGYFLKEIIGYKPGILEAGVNPPEFYQELWESVLSGQDWSGEFCHKKKDGTLIRELYTVLPVKNFENNIKHFVFIKMADSGT